MRAGSWCRGFVPFMATWMAGAGTKAQDQYFFIQTTNTVSPGQPSTDLQVWASFNPAFYAFFTTRFDLSSLPDKGEFYDARFPEPFYGTEGGLSPDGDSIAGIWSQQIQWGGEVYADTSDPIKIWECSWTTDDFTPRRIDVNLLASEFWVYTDELGQGKSVDFAPIALGEINVVPAPCPAALMGAVLMTVPRRRGRARHAG